MNFHLLSLLLSVIIFISLLVFILNNNIVKTKLQNSYLIESMANPVAPTSNLEDSFCRFYDSNNSAMSQNESCGSLTQTNCMNTKCCVWGKNSDGEKCYAGGVSGPTFRTDRQGTNINMDSYYYMNKCYGNCS
jgi:hypothetical protein